MRPSSQGGAALFALTHAPAMCCCCTPTSRGWVLSSLLAQTWCIWVIGVELGTGPWRAVSPSVVRWSANHRRRCRELLLLTSLTQVVSCKQGSVHFGGVLGDGCRGCGVLWSVTQVGAGHATAAGWCACMPLEVVQVLVAGAVAVQLWLRVVGGWEPHVAGGSRHTRMRCCVACRC